MKISVIGASSFIGRNLIENLKTIQSGKNRTRPNLSISEIYEDEVASSDAVIVLPGETADMYNDRQMIRVSSQESALRPDGRSLIYRLPEIVGKWQEPTSGIAHLCYAVANDEQYEIDDRREIKEMLFVDDFVDEMLDALEGHPHRCDFPAAGSSSPDPTAPFDGVTPIPNKEGAYCYSPKALKATMGSVIDHLEAFNRLNTSLVVPEIPADTLAYKLYSMYLSYLPERKMSYPVNMCVDNRGVFAELIKTGHNGQISINIARPGNVRGQHWHNKKWEIFIVVSGHGLIQEREIGTDKVISFEVRGEEMRAVIMLPGYTHSIKNLEKNRDLVTVMFANEQFDPTHPDTFFEMVDTNSAC